MSCATFLRRRRGFTIIELMVVMVLAAVLLVLAAPSFIEFQRASELNTATNNLLAAINSARNEALRQGRRTGIVPASNGDWSRGWQVFVDADLNGQANASDPIVLTQDLPAGGAITISGSGTAAAGNGAYLLFDGSGYSRSRSGAFSAATLTVQRRDTTADAGRRLVKVARTGRVRSCRPGTAGCDDTEDE